MKAPLLLVASCLLASQQLAAQMPMTIKVALTVDEETGGLFQSAFASELRSLGDVTIVDLAGHPD